MASSQKGLFEGQSPLQYDPSNPIILFLFQVVIILIVSHLVHFVLSRLYQPRVVSEVVGGLILGPSVLGHVPHYMDTLFPTSAKPIFDAASTLGLIFLMFLVGLETDLTVVRKHWRSATAVAGLGIVIPFGLGVAVAVGIYHHIESKNENAASFGVFVLFVGLAMAITAFPVLARILMELDLLTSPVGLIALSAGVANDVVGWTLLGVSIALAQASSGQVAIYMLLCCTAWALLMVYGIRPLLHRFVRLSLSEASKPAEMQLAVISLLVLVSALFTGMIAGIHPIFGAFMAGAIVPKEGGYHEKLEIRFAPVVYNVLLPPFFALCGINTNISGLTSGADWGYVAAVCFIAFVGKVVGGFIAAKLCKIKTRESLTIGVLMSCKGIVELIALNIGLQAGIISQETFTIFVVMAVILTGLTQPVVGWLFPMSLRDPHGHIYSEQSFIQSSQSTSERVLPSTPETAEKPSMLTGV
ncbi:uncharacterized protein MYCFIDRAFT_143206 [Pseudocercospora fijiensis CIRAD86]|uniref:Cation/H+ exchanger transmembrane domain-containing protein n=1 Tax=Pseudocercospora fijiensis (strain CIRAD86) TaxID=383855 RepID=M3ARL7_PSEFD|nr:uncharacterized protein MYCFIDRAFT_143206 [Pseudocercospora fijiensis CIRAD86]EME79703.1 hypothetical protein MYCFIDRAFT_143206 [Pseudocercospora fijiensis CIRAD86]